MPEAISGSGGHTATWNAARKLADFGLDESEIFSLLKSDYNPRCSPPWSDRDLEHKAKDAFANREPRPVQDREPVRYAREHSAPPDDGWDSATPEPESTVRPPSARAFVRGDHVELAGRLVADLQIDAPVVHTDARFYRYEKILGIFENVEPSRLSTHVQGFAGAPVVQGEKKPRALCVRSHDVRGVVGLAADQLNDPEFFDAATPGIAFENGFVSVSSAGTTLKPHSPKHRARYAYPFAFEQGARPERFLNFLGQVFRGDADRAEKIELIREFFGVALLGQSTKFQRALVLHGAGANGKSVASQVLEHCAPPGSVCSIPPQDLAQEYRRAMLAGKLLNLVAELPEADILDSESWKATVAGDSTTGREIHKAPFTFKPRAGHLYSANRLPGTADQTHGFWRRLMVVSFERVFTPEEQDPRLADSLMVERSQIVGWALEGAERVFKRGGYTIPASTASALDAWRVASDQVLAFVEDQLERIEVQGPVSAGLRGVALYEEFKRWSVDNGHRPMASNKFAERLKILGISGHRTKSGMVYPVRLRG